MNKLGCIRPKVNQDRSTKQPLTFHICEACRDKGIHVGDMLLRLQTDIGSWFCAVCEKINLDTQVIAINSRRVCRDVYEVLEIDAEDSYVCYNCGNNLQVGVDASDALCWHCRNEELI